MATNDPFAGFLDDVGKIHYPNGQRPEMMWCIPKEKICDGLCAVKDCEFKQHPDYKPEPLTLQTDEK